MISDDSATSLGLDTRFTPGLVRCRRSCAAESMSYAVNGYPADARCRAMGSPMTPSPTKPMDCLLIEYRGARTTALCYRQPLLHTACAFNPPLHCADIPTSRSSRVRVSRSQSVRIQVWRMLAPCHSRRKPRNCANRFREKQTLVRTVPALDP